MERVGPAGEPAVAAVGAIHGDEPCGARAIERFLEETHDLGRPAKLIVANERALEAGERYLDADLNRSFPGDPDADAHEVRLAARLREEIEGLPTLGFHSTVSYDEPFATLADLTPEKAATVRALPVEHAADFTGAAEGRSVTLPGFLNVEAGRQGTAAAAGNAHDCLCAFLRHADVLAGDPEPTDTALHRVVETVEKRPGVGYGFHGENFRRVGAGETYAATTDGEELRATEPFVPVLMSGDGHDRLLGYRAHRRGEIGAVAGRS